MSHTALARRVAGTRVRLRLGMAGIIALAVLTRSLVGAFDRYQADQAVTVCLLLAIAQAWNVLAGFGGQLSLGVSAFVGAGAYGTGIVMSRTDISYGPALVVATGCGVVLAAALAAPLLRLRGDYFAIGTLAATLALQAFIINWSFAGGSTGLSLPIDRLPDEIGLTRAAVLVASLSLLLTWYVQHSDFGLRLRAVRDAEGAASGLGVSAFRHRFAVLVLTSGITSLAGGMIALQQASFEPIGMLGINWTLSAVLVTVVGGMATFTGPIVGVFIVYFLLTQQLEDFQSFSLILEGALLILLIRFAPKGLVPLGASLVSRLFVRPSACCRSSTGTRPTDANDTQHTHTTKRGVSDD